MKNFDMDKVKRGYEYVCKFIGYCAVVYFVCKKINEISTKLATKIIEIVLDNEVHDVAICDDIYEEKEQEVKPFIIESPIADTIEQLEKDGILK